MLRRNVSGIVLLLLVGISALAFNIQLVKTWSGGTIYVRGDGSIDPPDAPICSDDNVTYTLTEDVDVSGGYKGIVVERDSIVIDGASYTLHVDCARATTTQRR